MLEVIQTRKSVRTFDDRPISDEDRQKIETYAKDITNPFDIPVEFVWLDAKEHRLSSPVLAGEKLYVVGKVKGQPFADVAFGYAFEKMILYAWSLGVGTVMIGGTMKREAFEKAAGVKDGELMPCVSPLGYPAKKRSMKESLMRKGVGADARISGDKLFYADAWGKALTPDDAMADVLEMVRWAPSAVNKQPWRIILKDGLWHFYEKKDKGYVHDATGDLQKIDIGIALCHFEMGVEALGRKVGIVIEDPGIEIPNDAEYILSARV